MTRTIDDFDEMTEYEHAMADFMAKWPERWPRFQRWSRWA